MEIKTGYCITTKKFTVRTRHREWLEQTQELYNQVLFFYFNLYLDKLAQESMNNQEAMRTLERRSLPGRDQREVPDPLPWQRIPLYFRRAAINAAIAAARSFLERGNQQERPRTFSESVTFYKGTYRDFGENEITLKVWDGQNWRWLRCRLNGNRIPEGAQALSPAMVLRPDGMELHVPIREVVEDGRTAKQRMEAGEKICSALFTNGDACIIACIADEQGNYLDAAFFKGAKEYAGHCRQILEKIRRSEAATGDDGNPKANQKYWMKLKHLKEYYGHWFSRQLIDYCVEHNARILALPLYEKPYFSYVMTKVGDWSPLHLSMQIRENLKYKAWQKGIVVLEINPIHTADRCSICGAAIRRRRKEFVCENGHRGNAYLNTARNQAKKCLNGFGKQVPEKTERESGRSALL